jgi:arylsulfatase A-like enzyme
LPRTLRLPLLVALLAGALAALGWDLLRPRDALPAPRRRVLLVTVDTLRADALGIAGQALPTTPFLDALLAEGQRFTRAVTPVPRTTPALASLLTGAYPHTTKVRSLVDPLAPHVVSVAELFRARGFRTRAVVSNHVLPPRRGLARGFERYDYAGDARDGFETTRAALAALGDVGEDEPVFLWVHYIDPHVPYAPPVALAREFDPGYEGPYATHFGGAPGSTGEHAFPPDLPKRVAIFRNPLPDPVTEHVRRLYYAEVRHTDDAIRALLEGLRAEGGPWTIVFTADHGESLGEQDYFWEHGDYVYDSTIRVPLAFVLPEGDPLRRPAAHQDWVSLVDVTPTLIELCDLPVPTDLAYALEGRSLVPLLAGGALQPRPVFAESERSAYPEEVRRRVGFDVAGRFRAVLLGDRKLIWTPGQAADLEYELYDLAADPGETRNLWRADHPEVAALQGELTAWLRGLDDPTAEPDARDLALLRSLGYVE